MTLVSDINKTGQKHAEIVPSVIGAQVPSGCHYVPKLYDIVKKAIIKRLKPQNLSSQGNTATSIAKVEVESTLLIS